LIEAAEGPLAPRMSTGVACKRLSAPAFLSSSRLCFRVTILTVGCDVHLLPSHTSQVALHKSGRVGGFEVNRIQPLARPLSVVAFMYHFDDASKNSSHLLLSVRFLYTGHPLHISSVGSYTPLIVTAFGPFAPRMSIAVAAILRTYRVTKRQRRG
jgi:hypothetical protein